MSALIKLSDCTQNVVQYNNLIVPLCQTIIQNWSLAFAKVKNQIDPMASLSSDREHTIKIYLQQNLMSVIFLGMFKEIFQVATQPEDLKQYKDCMKTFVKFIQYLLKLDEKKEKPINLGLISIDISFRSLLFITNVDNYFTFLGLKADMDKTATRLQDLNSDIQKINELFDELTKGL